MADFNSLFSQKKGEKADHGSYKITWIHYSELHDSKYQYCPGSPAEIESLADQIAGDGKILQNLIVRKTGDKCYEIIAGHKRCAAVRVLVEKRKLEKYSMVPCMVSTESEAKTRFSVISTNAHHEKTPYEIMHELIELEYLIRTFPEEFPDLQTGRMVDRLAKQTGMAKSIIGEYQSIARNLGKAAMEKFKNEEIDKSAASALAGLPVDEQNNLLASGITKNKDIKIYKKEKKGRQDPLKHNNPSKELKSEAILTKAAPNILKEISNAESEDKIWEGLYNCIYEYVHRNDFHQENKDKACEVMLAAYMEGCR